MDKCENIEKLYSEISALSHELVEHCAARGIRLATAESCTGGMISAALTSVSGSSAVIEFGLCSYSNRIKHEALGVSDDTLIKYTEYSGECAEEMALGARRASGADIAVSTTGVAGPTGGTETAPVGTVFIGISTVCGTESARFSFGGDRGEVRAAAAKAALEMLARAAGDIHLERG